MQEYNECLVCNKPLGHDSREQGYPFCHDHRKCQRCNEDLYPYEAKAILDTSLKIIEKDQRDSGETFPIEKIREYLLMDIIHPACRINDPTAMISIRASEYRLLNLIRNLVMPETDASVELNGIRVVSTAREFIADMEYDKLARTLERMEKVASVIRIAIMQDVDHKKKQIADRTKFEALAREEVARASKQLKEPKESKPSKEPIHHELSEKEIAYKEFLITFSLTEGQEAKKTFSNWFKTVKGWQTAGIPYEAAKEMASVALKKGLAQ